MINVYTGTKFPIHKVWWLREASQIGQTFIHGRTPSDPAVSAAIGHRFIAKKKEIKNADTRV